MVVASQTTEASQLIILLPLPSQATSHGVWRCQSSQKYVCKNPHSHINVFQMIAFFTPACTYKNSSVSKPVGLEVNTLVPCTSQIRQFGRRKKAFLSYLKKGTHFDLRKGKLICLLWLHLSSVKLEAEQIYVPHWEKGKEKAVMGRR